MAITINYGDTPLAVANDGQTVTVNCSGKKMNGNIAVVVPPASPQFVKGTMYIASQAYGGTVTFVFCIGMDWDFLFQILEQWAPLAEDQNGHITIFGDIIYYDGFPVTKQDAIINGATYTT